MSVRPGPDGNLIAGMCAAVVLNVALLVVGWLIWSLVQ